MAVFVIAEAGVNHNRDLELAKSLVDTAAAAGADAIKFQTFRAEAVATAGAGKAEYQKRTTDADASQLDLLRQLELPREWHGELKERAKTQGMVFLSTAFDIKSLGFLVGEVGIDRIKIPSGELTNGPLLWAAGRSGLPAIVSTGMAHMDEIADALAVMASAYLGDEIPEKASFDAAFGSSGGRQILREKVTLLHCTTEYPAPFADIDLRAMKSMSEVFDLETGLSDHSEGITVPIAAAAMGASVIEKHFTMDRKLPGPDHLASLEPAELRDMIAAIRTTETAVGMGEKKPKGSETANRELVRRSLVALHPIAKGESFTDENLGMLRPGTGISPMRYWEFIGTPAARAFDAGEAIQE